MNSPRSSLVALAACASLLASCAEPLGPRRQPATRPGVGKAPYGELPDGGSVDIYTLTNANGVEVKLINYGAIIVSVKAPDYEGRLADVALGFESLDDWLNNPANFGATIGRYANRIANASFTLDGQAHSLTRNRGQHHIHGGAKGFQKVLWNAQPIQTATAAGVRFTYFSKEGEEGYPGNLSVTALYTLNNNNELKGEFTATTDKPTVVNLTQHTYWNLAGHASGDVLAHTLTIFADQYTPVDKELIPTGEVKEVLGTPYDFTAPTPIGKGIAEAGGGYDINYVLRNPPGRVGLAARLLEPRSGRILEVLTDQPGLQLYTGNHLDGSLIGKNGAAYRRYAGVCLETQAFPDSPNKPNFPSPVLRPGETYRHVVIYRFSARQPASRTPQGSSPPPRRTGR